MTEFKSDIKTIPYSDEEVYSVLSDLNKLELVKDKIPKDKVKEIEYDKDSCTLNVPPIGKIRFVVVDRVPCSSIKLRAEQIPFGVNLFVELAPLSLEQTQIQLRVEADLNPFIRPFVSKPLQEELENISATLASIPYSELKNK
jgi:hypothetical protein